MIMQGEKDKLEEEAHNLAQKLQAVLHDKYVPSEVFDADTPIDKTLKLLQTIIGVGPCYLALASVLHASCLSTWHVLSALRTHTPQAS